MGTKEEFDQLKRETPLLAAKVVIQVRAKSVWVGMFSTEDSAIAKDPAWSRTFPHPEDKTAEECAERALFLALGAAEAGLLRPKVALEEEPW